MGDCGTVTARQGDLESRLTGSSVGRDRMDSMTQTKWTRRLWFGLAVAVAGATAARAESILEVSPSQVIEMVIQGPLEKVPVVSGVALASGGDLLATAGDDHLARLWNARNGQLLRTLSGHRTGCGA